MRELGLGTYRFSVAWPRIKPDGTGPVNPRGLDFYDRLVDELLAHGHRRRWSRSTTGTCRRRWRTAGGWTDRDTAYRFADYAAAVHARLGDRVRTWTTLNEPWCSAFLGYGSGVHAPGRQRPARPPSARRTTCCWGTGWRRRRCARRAHARSSLTLNLTRRHARSTRGDRARRGGGAAGRRPAQPACSSTRCCAGATRPTCWRMSSASAASAHIRDGDLAIIAAPIDLLGINYYQPDAGRGRRSARAGDAAYPGTRGRRVRCRTTVPATAMGWPIDADGLSEPAGAAGRGLPGHAADDHRERRGLRRRRRRRPGRTTPTGSPTSTATCAPCTPRIARGRGRARLPRLVAAGQLRVGVRLRQALRHRARRLRHPAPHPKDSALWFRTVIRANAL